ncbi:MAG: hypothetical protein NW201_08575 [Gemmatimonadales bacterium]|nr:hypothetical protein [Gemmatimonadales bacterium]
MTIPPLGGPPPGGAPRPASRGAARQGSSASARAALAGVARPEEGGARSLIMDVIREALTMGQPGEALELLDGIWQKAVTREDAWFMRGQALYELQRFLEAGEITQQGIEKHPNSGALYYLLCNCETQLNHLDAAERAILQALRILPENALVRARYAHLLVRMDRVAEAAEQLKLAEAIAPGHPVLAQERKFLAAVTSGPFGQQNKVGALLHEATDPYARSALGLSLLPGDERLASALPAGTPGESAAGAGRGIVEMVAAYWWVLALGGAGLLLLALR